MPTCRNALVISAVKATFQRLNLMRIEGKFGIRLGPANMQSFRDKPLGPLAEASKTGRTFVLRLAAFTTG